MKTLQSNKWKLQKLALKQICKYKKQSIALRTSTIRAIVDETKAAVLYAQILTMTGYIKWRSLPFLLWCVATTSTFFTTAPLQLVQAHGYSTKPSLVAIDRSMWYAAHNLRLMLRTLSTALYYAAFKMPWNGTLQFQVLPLKPARKHSIYRMSTLS